MSSHAGLDPAPTFPKPPARKRWIPDQVRGDDLSLSYYIASSPEAARILPGGRFALEPMDRDDRLKRLRFRAWHRGTREADFMIGGFFDAHGAGWGESEMDWFEALLEEQDADIIAWAIGTAPPPARYEGEAMRRLQQLNYIKHPE